MSLTSSQLLPRLPALANLHPSSVPFGFEHHSYGYAAALRNLDTETTRHLCLIL